MKCITYKQNKDKEMAYKSVVDNCRIILNLDDSKLAQQLFRKVCGTVFYLSLFSLPKSELIHERRYTIESVVASIPGFMQESANTWLENITNCSSPYAILAPNLDQILHECTIPEICDKLGIPGKEFYLAAFRVYLLDNSSPFPSNMVEILRNPDITLNDAWNIFEDAIYRGGANRYGKRE